MRDLYISENYEQGAIIYR